MLKFEARQLFYCYHFIITPSTTSDASVVIYPSATEALDMTRFYLQQKLV